jgi:hypothetical protein
LRKADSRGAGQQHCGNQRLAPASYASRVKRGRDNSIVGEQTINPHIVFSSKFLTPSS